MESASQVQADDVGNRVVAGGARRSPSACVVDAVGLPRLHPGRNGPQRLPLRRQSTLSRTVFDVAAPEPERPLAVIGASEVPL